MASSTRNGLGVSYNVVNRPCQTLPFSGLGASMAPLTLTVLMAFQNVLKHNPASSATSKIQLCLIVTLSLIKQNLIHSQKQFRSVSFRNHSSTQKRQNGIVLVENHIQSHWRRSHAPRKSYTKLSFNEFRSNYHRHTIPSPVVYHRIDSALKPAFCAPGSHRHYCFSSFTFYLIHSLPNWSIYLF